MAALLASLLAVAPDASAGGTVTVAIQGKGDVTGSGVNCNETGGPDCSEAYADEEDCAYDPEVGGVICETIFPYAEFTAGADRNGFQFSDWDGCDDESGRSCGLTVYDDATVTARFTDVENPSVSGLSPGGGVQRGTITLSANAGDNAGVKRVEFRVGGTTVGADTTAPYSISYNTASRSDGGVTIAAVAIDTSERVSSPASAGITIDNTAPTLSISSGPNGQTFAPGSTQTWTFSASDATSGIQSVQCSVVPAGSPPSFGACSGGNGSHSVTGRPAGDHTFTVRARDAGGLETLASRSFSIDGSSPDTTITSGPADGSSSSSTSATFDFSASETGSTFECRVYQAALTPGPFSGCSGNGTHTASGFAPGTYSFEVVAIDPYGNRDATPAKRTFTVTAPGGDGGTGGTGGTGGSDGGGEPGGPTLEELAAALSADLAAAAGPLQRTRLSALRRKKKFVVTVRALSAGRLTINLAGSVTRGGASANTILAKGARTVAAAGSYKVTVRLTTKGSRALREARRLRGKLTGRFIEATSRSVTRSKKVTLKRR